MTMPHRRPRFGDATAQADLPSATGPDSRGKCLAGRARADAAPLWTCTPWLRRFTPAKVFMAFAWIGKIPSPHARQERLASSVSQLWRLAETKKPGPSLL